jgi:phthalate 4,5-cis-dihydrodiol dehydrogenase
MADNQRVIRMGAIGIGAGATAMVPIFANHPGYKWVAGCDIDKNVLEAFGRDYNAEMYTDAEAMCKNPNVDAVYIASPNRFHVEHAMAALQNGKHVLSEKPMTITLESSEDIIKLAEQKGLKLAVNVKHSFERRILKLREIVNSGQYGKLRMMNYIYYNDWIYRPRTPEELNPEWGGGVPWRQGPHQLDILRTVAGGMVRSVKATAGTWDESRPVPGAHAAFLEFEDGAVATAVYSGYDRFRTAPLIRGMGAEGPVVNAAGYGRARKERQASTIEQDMAAKEASRYGGRNRAPAGDGNGAAAAGGRGGGQGGGRGGGGEGGGEGGGGGGWISGGPFLISFDHADIWMMPDGLLICDDDKQELLPVPNLHGDGRWGRIETFRDAILKDEEPPANGRWGKATLEVILSIFESSNQRREVMLSHQVPTADKALAPAMV